MLQTLCSWVLGAITRCLDVLVTSFLSLFGDGLGMFTDYFPAAGDLYFIIRGVALGLVIGIAVFNILKFFVSPVAKVTEPPFVALLRAGVAAAMVMMGGYVLELVCTIFKGPYSSILGYSTESGFSWSLFVDSMDNWGRNAFESTAHLGTGGATAAALVLFNLIAVICLGVNVFKLLLEIVQRYLMVGVLVYTGPLGWSTLASPNTMGIFSKWISMVISQNIMMLISAWSLKLLMSCLMPGRGSGGEPLNPFFQMIFALAFASIAQRFDSYLMQIGMNPAITGVSLLDEMIAVGKTMQKRGEKRGSSAKPLGSEPSPRYWGGGGVFSFFRGGARSASGAYSAARQDGKSISEATKETAAMFKQGAKDVAGTVAHPFSGIGGDANEKAIKRAMSESGRGNAESWENLTSKQQAQGRAMNADGVTRGTSGKYATPHKDTGGFKQIGGSSGSIGLDPIATRAAGMYMVDGGDGVSFAASMEGDAVTAEFAQNAIATGGMDQFEPQINSTIRNIADSSEAIKIDAVDAEGVSEASQRAVWASTVLSTNINRVKSDDSATNELLSGFTGALDHMSRGEQIPDGDYSISFDTVPTAVAHRWDLTDSSSGARHTSGTLHAGGTGANAGKDYSFSIYNEAGFKQYRSEHRGNSADSNSAFRRYSDRAGNRYYIKFEDSQAEHQS